MEIELIKPIHCEASFFWPSYSKKKSNKNKYWNGVLIYFLVKKIGGEISIDGCDEDEKTYIDLPEWIEIEKLKDLKFYNPIDNDKVIREALEINNKREILKTGFPLEFNLGALGTGMTKREGE